ncbi:MAG: radical SAM protein [Deltaproteobacteria bacterium]|nr:radical SAM protein [Deltaproteobacteria bacterium]
MSIRRLETLRRQFPDIAPSVILKTDLLREGIRFTPVLNEIGRWCIPHFVMWNPEHDFDVRANGQLPEDWIMTPWNVRLADGTTVKTKFWNPDAPYEIQRIGERYVLLREGEEVEEVFFHRRPDWYFGRTTDNTVHAAVMQLWAPECWYSISLRYCQYSKTGDQCRFCCLMPSEDGAEGGKLAGLGYEVSLTPDNLAETFRAGGLAGKIRHFAITGGAILNNTKEIDRMARLFRRLSKEREELGLDTMFWANPSGLEAHELQTLKDSGVDGVTINLEVWDPKLWPVIVPGKHKFFGRERYLESMKRAVSCFGPWRVSSFFVVGVERVEPDGFATDDAAIASVLEGVDWCVEHQVMPATTMWLPAPGSPWADKPAPPTEYFLKVGRAIHELMDRRGAHKAAVPGQSSMCQECQDCSIHIDHYYAEQPRTQRGVPASAWRGTEAPALRL